MLQTFAAAVVCMAALSTAQTTTAAATTAAATTTTLDVVDKSVQVTVSVANLNFANVNANETLKTSYTALLRKATKSKLQNVPGIVDEDITMTLTYATVSHKQSLFDASVDVPGIRATITVAPEHATRVPKLLQELTSQYQIISMTFADSLKRYKDIDVALSENMNTGNITAVATRPILVAGGPRPGRTTTIRTTRAPTTTVDVSTKSVLIVYTCAALDFAKVNSDAAFKAWYIGEVKKEVRSVSSGYGVTMADIKVQLSAGSVKAAVTVAPDTKTRIKVLMPVFTGDKASSIRLAQSIKYHKALDKFLASGKKQADVSITKSKTPTLVAGGVRTDRESDGSVPGSPGAQAVVASATQAAALVAGSLALMASF